MSTDETTAIGKSTGVTIGLAIIIIGAAVTAAWWFGNWTGNDRSWKEVTAKQLQLIEVRLKSIEEGAIRDRWTSSDMIRWTERLRDANGDITVPIPLTH